MRKKNKRGTLLGKYLRRGNCLGKRSPETGAGLSDGVMSVRKVEKKGGSYEKERKSGRD